LLLFGVLWRRVVEDEPSSVGDLHSLNVSLVAIVRAQKTSVRLSFAISLRELPRELRVVAGYAWISIRSIATMAIRVRTINA
jgi:hypothetical protein